MLSFIWIIITLLLMLFCYIIMCGFPFTQHNQSTTEEVIPDYQHKFNVRKSTIADIEHRGLMVEYYYTEYNTIINILSNNLNYTLKINGDRKYNTFTKTEKEIYIEDILAIKYKIGFTFESKFVDYLLSFCILLPVVFLVMAITVSNDTTMGLYVQKGYQFIFMFCAVFSVIYFVIVDTLYFTCKCIEIKYKTNDGIEKLIFPIGRISVIPVLPKTRKLINRLFEDLKQKNQNIKIKRDKSILILIPYIIIVLIYFYVFFHMIRMFIKNYTRNRKQANMKFV